MIYYWVLRKPQRLGYGFIFLAGIINDVVLGVPIGSNALALLIIAAVAAYVRMVTVNVSLFTDWFSFIPALLVANFIYFAALYYTNYSIDYLNLLINSVFTFIFYPLLWLIFGLINAAKILKPGGTIIVVTFHSIEDKIVKFFFKNLSEKKSISRYMPKTEEKDNLFKLGNKKPIVPSNQELKTNPPSRSAKLRFAIKEKEVLNFEKEILEKFNYLLEIENLSVKL